MATHAAGVVIPEENLAELVPMYKDPSSDSLLPSTQFDMYASENAGLVKFDLLGLKSLTVISKTINLLNKKINFERIKFDASSFANEEDIKYFKETFENILFDDDFFGIFRMSKIKEFLLEVI